MISNDRRPPVAVTEDTLKVGNAKVERKNFSFTLKRNSRGPFLRITEEAGRHHDTIIIPASGLKDFRRVLDEMVAFADTMPPS